MCGHVGLAGRLALKEESVLKRLLVYDYFRGPHSTGLGAVLNDMETMRVAKIASHPIDLFDTKSFDKTCNGSTSSVFIGHNRYATKGKINAVNAHPFIEGDIVGAHNGTLYDDCWKELDKNLGEETSVDSLALMKHIDAVGIEETIKTIRTGMSPSSGAWALVFYDRDSGDLNFLRNTHRPLWYSFSKDCKTILWGSEWEIIYAASSLSNMGGEEYELWEDEKGNSFFPVSEDTLYRFKVKDLKDNKTGKPIKPRVKKLEAKVGMRSNSSRSNKGSSNVVSYPSGGKDNKAPFLSGIKNNNSSTSNGLRAGQRDLSSAKYMVVTSFSDDFFASAVDTQKAFEHVNHLCCFCWGDISKAQEGLVYLDSQQIILCPSCSGEKINRVILNEEDFSQYHELVTDTSDVTLEQCA